MKLSPSDAATAALIGIASTVEGWRQVDKASRSGHARACVVDGLMSYGHLEPDMIHLFGQEKFVEALWRGPIVKAILKEAGKYHWSMTFMNEKRAECFYHIRSVLPRIHGISKISIDVKSYNIAAAINSYVSG